MGRLKERSHGVGRHYAIELIPNDSGEQAIAIRWDKHPQMGTKLTHSGVYCLPSNQTDWDSERLWWTYILLTDLKAVFRSLKSELGLRPVFHHQEGRVEGHLFITVLAFQFVPIIRHRLHEQGIAASWTRLRATVRVQRRVSVTFRRADGRLLQVRKATQPEPEPEPKASYTALGVPHTPGRLKKTIT